MKLKTIMMSQKKVKAKRLLMRGVAHREPRYKTMVGARGAKVEMETIIIDARKHPREYVNRAIKAANGNSSKYIPSKVGYGPHGAKKY